MEQRRFLSSAWLVIMLLVSTAKGNRSKCDAPDAPVNSGTTVNITCTFFRDIEDTTFAVRRFRSSDNNPEDVAECFFVEEERHCQVSPGFQIQSVAGNKEVLTIAHVDRSFEGNYTCQLVTSELQQRDSCQLRVSEAISRDEEVTKPSEREEDQEKGSKGENTVAIVVSMVISTIIVAITGVIVFVTRRKRKQFNREPTRDKDGKKSPESESLNSERDPENNTTNDSEHACTVNLSTGMCEDHMSVMDKAGSPQEESAYSSNPAPATAPGRYGLAPFFMRPTRDGHPHEDGGMQSRNSANVNSSSPVPSLDKRGGRDSSLSI